LNPPLDWTTSSSSSKLATNEKRRRRRRELAEKRRRRRLDYKQLIWDPSLEGLPLPPPLVVMAAAAAVLQTKLASAYMETDRVFIRQGVRVKIRKAFYQVYLIGII
jgi:hypothetical protein